MFTGVPQPTPFDLHWRMFGIDVRVNPWFWLMAALLGWSWFQRFGVLFLALWMLCVFASVLLHELGHVVMGRLFGSDGHILLYSFGGLAFGCRDLRSRWYCILVSFAGPLAQFVLFGIVLGFDLFLSPTLELGIPRNGVNMVEAVITMLLEINLFWPVLNLLPIYPLDGGQISREGFEGTLGQRGVVVSLGISFGVATMLAIHMIWPFIPFVPFGGVFMAIFFALMAVTSFQLLQAEMNRGRWRDDRMPWE